MKTTISIDTLITELDERIESIRANYSRQEDISVEDEGKIEAYTDIYFLLYKEKLEEEHGI